MWECGIGVWNLGVWDRGVECGIRVWNMGVWDRGVECGSSV